MVERRKKVCGCGLWLRGGRKFAVRGLWLKGGRKFAVRGLWLKGGRKFAVCGLWLRDDRKFAVRGLWLKGGRKFAVCGLLFHLFGLLVSDGLMHKSTRTHAFPHAFIRDTIVQIFECLQTLVIPIHAQEGSAA